MTCHPRNMMMLSLVLFGRKFCVRSLNIPHAQLTRSYPSRSIPRARFVASSIHMVDKDNADEIKPSGASGYMNLRMTGISPIFLHNLF